MRISPHVDGLAEITGCQDATVLGDNLRKRVMLELGDVLCLVNDDTRRRS